jgi:acetyl-CoA carboxylase carboxyltransferase component
MDDVTQSDLAAELHARTDRIRTEMGGADKVARLRERGGSTIRDRIESLVDEKSFRELGTFTRSKRLEDRDSTPGDGKIGGHATVDGRAVVVFGDDVTVRQGSSSVIAARKEDRLVHHAFTHGTPIVHIGETGGGRIPDIIGAEGISSITPFPDLARRRHRVPMATVIVGKSFGGSSTLSAMSDFTVQVRGSCLALTSPRVFEVATGEIMGFEELGGVDVHADVTGQIDLGVDTDDEAWDAVRRWLSYLPSNAWTPTPRGEHSTTVELDPQVPAVVPTDSNQAYDMGDLIERVTDPDTWFELRPRIGRSLMTGLARVDGWSVGVIANNPMFDAGAIDADGCEKATRLLVLCDSFDIPVLFLQDVPGFLVGSKAERSRLLPRATRLREALAICRCPTLTVIVRQAFGPASKAMNGTGMDPDAIYAWPGAEIGQMDPSVDVNQAEHETAATEPYEAAGVLGVDEVIDPQATRMILARDLGLLATREPTPHRQRPLSYWATC